MQVAFRVDASATIGTGHLMRCLTLADSLIQTGASVHFLSRDLPQGLVILLRDRQIPLHPLTSNSSPIPEAKLNRIYETWLGVSWNEDAQQTAKVLAKIAEREPLDWLIVDHYALDQRWEAQLRPYATRIMVLDDLADRPHNCDLLLDCNLYNQYEQRYHNLVPKHCQQLLGPAYALLRPEFYHARQHLKSRSGQIQRILVSFGGSDPTGETLKALEAIRQLPQPDLAIDVVIGSANQHQLAIAQRCEAWPNVTLHCQINYMAELMTQADFAIASGGTSTWERCFLGLPSVVIAIAPNQVEALTCLGHAGVIHYLGEHCEIDTTTLSQTVQKLLHQPDRLIKLSQASLMLMKQNDPKRIVAALQSSLMT